MTEQEKESALWLFNLSKEHAMHRDMAIMFLIVVVILMLLFGLVGRPSWAREIRNLLRDKINNVNNRL